VAILDIVLGLMINGGILDGVAFLLLGGILLVFKSRFVAILLFLFSVADVVLTFMAMLGIVFGGRNILLSIFVLYVSIATVYATFKYHKLK
jgi:hypothetical protein